MGDFLETSLAQNLSKMLYFFIYLQFFLNIPEVGSLCVATEWHAFMDRLSEGTSSNFRVRQARQVVYGPTI